jgi:inner membrane protein
MPTIFTHAAFAFALSKLAIDLTSRDTGDSANQPSTMATIVTHKRLLLFASLLAVLPDADALWRHWVTNNDLLRHRGLTHSLLFAALTGLAAAFLFLKMKWNADKGYGFLAAVLGLATASHGFFDAMTTGGQGVAFFAPFNNARHFFAFRPIPVAPFSAAALLTARGVNLLLWELALIWTFAIGAVIWNRHHLERKVAAIVCWAVCLLMWMMKL